MDSQDKPFIKGESQIVTTTSAGAKAETLAFIRAVHDGFAANTRCAWAIEYLGQAGGVIGLDSITWELRARRVDRAELAYWLAPKLWNRGLTNSASRETAMTTLRGTPGSLRQRRLGTTGGDPLPLRQAAGPHRNDPAGIRTRVCAVRGHRPDH